MATHSPGAPAPFSSLTAAGYRGYSIKARFRRMFQYDFQQGVRRRLEKMLLADCDNIIADAHFLVEQWPDLALEVASWRTCRAGTGVASLFILLGLCLRDSPAEKRFCSCF